LGSLSTYDMYVNLVIRSRFNLSAVIKSNPSFDILLAMCTNLAEHCQDARYGDTTSNFIVFSSMIRHRNGIARDDRQLVSTLCKLCPTHYYFVQFFLFSTTTRAIIINEALLTRLIISRANLISCHNEFLLQIIVEC